MKQLVVAVAVVLAIGTPGQAADESWRTDPTAFINHFAEAGITGILEAETSVAEKTERFRDLFNEGFDIPAISRFVLGRSWRQAKDDEKGAFIDIFEDVIVYTWSRRFSEYDGQTIKVQATSPDGETGTLVDSVVVDDKGQTVAVQWRLRQRDEGLRIVDVIVEGVSMAITYRQDYASVIRQNGGMQGLLDELRKQVAATKPS